MKREENNNQLIVNKKINEGQFKLMLWSFFHLKLLWNNNSINQHNQQLTIIIKMKCSNEKIFESKLWQLKDDDTVNCLLGRKEINQINLPFFVGFVPHN